MRAGNYRASVAQRSLQYYMHSRFSLTIDMFRSGASAEAICAWRGYMYVNRLRSRRDCTEALQAGIVYMYQTSSTTLTLYSLVSRTTVQWSDQTRKLRILGTSLITPTVRAQPYREPLKGYKLPSSRRRVHSKESALERHVVGTRATGSGRRRLSHTPLLKSISQSVCCRSERLV